MCGVVGECVPMSKTGTDVGSDVGINNVAGSIRGRIWAKALPVGICRSDPDSLIDDHIPYPQFPAREGDVLHLQESRSQSRANMSAFHLAVLDSHSAHHGDSAYLTPV